MKKYERKRHTDQNEEGKKCANDVLLGVECEKVFVTVNSRVLNGAIMQ